MSNTKRLNIVEMSKTGGLDIVEMSNTRELGILAMSTLLGPNTKGSKFFLPPLKL